MPQSSFLLLKSCCSEVHCSLAHPLKYIESLLSTTELGRLSQGDVCIGVQHGLLLLTLQLIDCIAGLLTQVDISPAASTRKTDSCSSNC